MNIPDEAIDAALMALFPATERDVARDIAWAQSIKEIIEAALPYLSDAARQPQRTSPTDWPDLPKAKS